MKDLDQQLIFETYYNARSRKKILELAGRANVSLDKHPKFEKYYKPYLKEWGEYDRSTGPGNFPPSASLYRIVSSDIDVFRAAGYESIAKHLEKELRAVK
jgi:hypothetical protein